MAKNLISNTLKENHLCLGSKCIALIIIYATIMREGWHSAIVAVAFLHCKKGEANFSQFPFLPKNAPQLLQKIQIMAKLLPWKFIQKSSHMYKFCHL